MSMPALTPAAGDQVAVVDPPVVLAHLDAGVERAQLVQRSPMRGRRSAAQQAGGSVDQSTCAHARHQRDRGSLVAYPVQVLFVAQQWPRAGAAGVNEHRRSGRSRNRMMRADHQALGSSDGPPIPRHAVSRVPVLGMVGRPVRPAPPTDRRRRVPRRRRRAGSRSAWGSPRSPAVASSSSGVSSARGDGVERQTRRCSLGSCLWSRRGQRSQAESPETPVVLIHAAKHMPRD